MNINEGHNRELMEQCRILKEYAQYVAKVRSYAKEMELSSAVERAVNECIQEGILAEFLQKNRARVIAMSIFEYDKEKEEKKLRKAEYEGGYDSGYTSGYDSGHRSGISEGESKKAREVVKAMLAAREPVEKVMQYTGYTAEKIREIENRE